MYDFATAPYWISLYIEENFVFFFISVHYLDKYEVGVASFELIEPNVENDADIARHCQHNDEHNDDALDGLVDEMDESWRSSYVILLCRSPWFSPILSQR